jgi:hypothetical protein
MEKLSNFVVPIISKIVEKVNIYWIIVGLLYLYGLTFIPDGILKKLNYFDFVKSHENILKIAGILLAPLLIYKISELLIICYKKYEENKKLHKPLHNLTPKEKAYLLPYIRDKENTLYVSLVDGVMSGLLRRKITYMPSSAMSYYKYAYNLQPWAREYLEKKPHLLDGAAEINLDFSNKSSI